MSYARFSEGNIYVFPDARGGYTCQLCSLSDTFEFNCETLEELHVHVIAHIEAGDTVPDRCLKRIEEEICRSDNDCIDIS